MRRVGRHGKEKITAVEFMRRIKGGGGFNLLELVITVLVLGVLVGICVPVFLSRARAADRNAAIYNLKVGEKCYDAVWYSRLAIQGRPEDVGDCYRDYDPPERFRASPQFQASGWVSVDGEYMSLQEPRIGWADLCISEGSEPLASEDIGGLDLAVAGTSFKIRAVWNNGIRLDRGEEDEKNWALLAHKIGVVDGYYWDNGWQPNTLNKHITLIVLERSGTAHFITLYLGNRLNSGSFDWADGAGSPEVRPDENPGENPGEEQPGQERENPGEPGERDGENPPVEPPQPPVTPEPPAPPETPTPPEPPSPPQEPQPPQYGFTATMIIVNPKTLNLSSQGVFTVELYLPVGYSLSQVNIPSLNCSGAFVIEYTLAAKKLVLKFYRQDLLNVPTGDNVVITLTGRLNDGTTFVAYDTIRVIDQVN